MGDFVTSGERIAALNSVNAGLRTSTVNKNKETLIAIFLDGDVELTTDVTATLTMNLKTYTMKIKKEALLHAFVIPSIDVVKCAIRLWDRTKYASGSYINVRNYADNTPNIGFEVELTNIINNRQKIPPTENANLEIEIKFPNEHKSYYNNGKMYIYSGNLNTEIFWDYRRISDVSDTSVVARSSDGVTYPISIDSAVPYFLCGDKYIGPTVSMGVADFTSVRLIPRTDCTKLDLSIFDKSLSSFTTFASLGTECEFSKLLVTGTTTIAGGVDVTGNLVIHGNLYIYGDEEIVDVTKYEVADPLVLYAKGNAGDLLDIGFYATFNDGATAYTGLIRDASEVDKRYRLVGSIDTPPVSNIFDFTTYTKGNLDVGALYSTAINSSGILDVDGITTLDKVTIDTTDGIFSVSGTGGISLASTSANIGLSVTGADLNLSTITSGLMTLTSAGKFSLSAPNADLIFSSTSTSSLIQFASASIIEAVDRNLTIRTRYVGTLADVLISASKSINLTGGASSGFRIEANVPTTATLTFDTTNADGSANIYLGADNYINFQSNRDGGGEGTAPSMKFFNAPGGTSYFMKCDTSRNLQFTSSFTAGHMFPVKTGETLVQGDAVILNEKGEVEKATIRNDPRCIGIFVKMATARSSIDYELKVCAVTISIGDSREWEYSIEEKKYVITCSGIKVCSNGGPIRVGTLLTTSECGGYLMAQNDTIIHNYTVGRCMQDVTFTGGFATGIYAFLRCGTG